MSNFDNFNYFDISKEQVNDIRTFLVDNIFRNCDVLFNDEIQKYNIPEIICGLYEIIHCLVYNERYDYMFHWTNKCGGWVETDYFIKLVSKYIKERDKNE